MRKITWRDKLKYRFDNIMSKGVISLVGILFGITAFVVVAAGILSFVLDRESNGSVLGAMWLSLMHAIDAGTLAGDAGNGWFILVMSLVTVCGIFITSMLIGLINTGLEAKMASLRKGKSKILETDHVVILGFNEGVYTILSELVEANANQKDAVVVVMDEREKEEMEDAIQTQLPNCKTTRILCRSGDASNFADLDMCSIESCRSIIINAGEDFATIKAVLAVTSLLKKGQLKTSAYITAVINEQENVEAARIAGEGYVEVVYFKCTIARIMAHTCRQPGLSSVFTELFGYGGDEIYIEEIPAVVGKTMAELCRYFPVSTAIGIQKAGKTCINPPAQTHVEQGDRIILIAADDGVSVPLPQAAAVQQKLISTQSARPASGPATLLVLGCNELLREVLLEEDSYVLPGSRFLVAAEENSLNEAWMPQQGELRNIVLEQRPCNILSRATLEKLLEEEIHNVLVLSSYADDEESADAKTLLLLLQLRDIARCKNHAIAITSEMRSVRNQELAQVTRVNDFVVSSSITSLIITQISQTRELKAIFEDLLDADGSEIYMKPAAQYIQTDAAVDIYTVAYAVAQKNEVLLGYKKSGENAGEFSIIVNPAKQSTCVFSPQDALIVLAEN